MLVGDISGYRKSLLLNFSVCRVVSSSYLLPLTRSGVTFWGGALTGVWDSCCRVLRFLSPLCECALQRGKYAIDLRGWESASVSQLFLNFPRIRLWGDTILSGFQLFSNLCIIFFFLPQSIRVELNISLLAGCCEGAQCEQWVVCTGSPRVLSWAMEGNHSPKVTN